VEIDKLSILGWREWAALPKLGVKQIRCKVDTGARTSALHAFYIEEFTQDSINMVRFGLHPIQGNTDKEIHCEAEVFDRRDVTDSGGHTETRYVIKTDVVLGKSIWPIEMTLTNRDTMRFRMLLGRTAMTDYFLVDSAGSHLMGKPASKPTALPVLNYLHDEGEEE